MVCVIFFLITILKTNHKMLYANIILLLMNNLAQIVVFSLMLVEKYHISEDIETKIKLR